MSVSAQFHTITRDSEILPTERRKEAYKHVGKDVTEGKKNKIIVNDTPTVRPDNQNKSEENSRNSDRKASLKTEQQQKKTDDITKSENNLPELTIPNLYKEIIRNGILYPKIVLAQAILETGWFRSSVCRNKHNLLDLPIHVQGNTMNSIIGRKVSELITLKCNISTKVETICFGLMKPVMRKIQDMFEKLFKF